MTSTRVKKSRSDQHYCTLKETDTTGLPKIAPNASRIRRMLRKLRTQALLQTEYKSSRSFFRNKSAMIAERKRHAKGYFFVIHPFSTVSLIFQCLFYITWSFSIFMAYIKFFLPVHWSYGQKVGFRIIEGLQYFVMLSFFLTAYIDNYKKVICIEPRAIIWKYARTYFIFDMIAVSLEDIVELFLDIEKFKEEKYHYYYIVATAIMLAYLIRGRTMMWVLHEVLNHYNFGDYVFFILSRSTLIVFFLNAFTCILSTLPNLLFGHEFPPKIFLVRANLHVLRPYSDVSIADLYSQNLLLVSSTFFGLTYGQYQITELSDFVPLMFIRMFGRFFTLYTLADFLKYFGLAGIAESKYEQYWFQLHEYMNTKNLPNDLRDKIFTYYEFKMQGNFFNEKKIKNTISQHLRSELFLYGAKRLIDKTPLLRNIGQGGLGNLFAQMTAETYLPNDVIFEYGVLLDHVYFVAYGTVIIYTKDGYELGHYIDGEEFAVINMWTGKPSSYKAIAGETSEIYKVHKKFMLEFMSEQTGLTRYYEKRAADRLRRYVAYKEQLQGGGNDVISQLREDKILEKRTVRQTAVDI